MLRKQRISLRIEIFIKLHNKIVWLDGFKQRHLFLGLLDREILRGILLQQKIFHFFAFFLYEYKWFSGLSSKASEPFVNVSGR